MTFKDVFSQTQILWPDSVNFADGIILVAKKSTTGMMLRANESDSFFSVSISNVYEKIKLKIDKQNVFQDVMAWTQYQYLITECALLFLKNNFVFHMKDINLQILEESFFQNLRDGFYEDELAIYKRVF